MRLHFPFKSLRTGLLLTYLALIAVSLGLLSWRIGSSLDASRFAETRRDQEGRAILAASAAGDWLANYRDGKGEIAMLEEEAATLSREINQPVAVLDPRGRVLVDTEHPHEAGLEEAHLPEVLLALGGRTGSAIRFDPDDDGDALFSVAPVYYNRERVGIIRLELPMRLVQAASQDLWLRIVGATLLAAVATIIVSLLFARALAEPLAQATRAATAIANGDLRQRVRESGPAELAQLARSFNSMAERISAVMEDQRTFVANAAHELRTPLTTVRLRAEALCEGAKDDPAVATQFLTDIMTETDRLSRLVDELLDLSRIETGLVALHREPVGVTSISRDVVDELAPRAQEANVTIDIAAGDALPLVSADPDQLRQVFINLIGNALKFTPAGGRIQLHSAVVVKSRDGDHLPPGEWLVTTVSDSGIGIAPEDLPHIFERFYRSDKARARDTGGAGLGLAIVKSIIAAHGGRVWAESEKGRGARIAFALPIAKNVG